jgi:flagellum-specific peptidoglycan hydrolase FlgJ
MPENPIPAIPLTPEETGRIEALPETEGLRTELPPPSHPVGKYNWLELASNQNLLPEQRSFLLNIGPLAEGVAQKLNVPVGGVIAQLALESGWGKSHLARKYNNYGGVKATNNWTGQVVEMPTSEKNNTEHINAKFRVYPTAGDYMNDYASVISRDRYKLARGTNDSYNFALELGKGGYHQDDADGYAKQVKSIAQRLGLE